MELKALPDQINQHIPVLAYEFQLDVGGLASACATIVGYGTRLASSDTSEL